MTRRRRITSPLGQILTLAIEPVAGQPTLALKREDGRKPDIIQLNDLAAEVLLGFIAAARLTVSGGLPEEEVGDQRATRLELKQSPNHQIVINQKHPDAQVLVDSPFWERLYCELAIAIPYLRQRSSHPKILTH